MADVVTDGISNIGGALITVFWIALGVAVVVRVIIAIRRRKVEGFRRGVLKPFASSAAVQSKLYGWEPSGSEQIVEQQNQSSAVHLVEVDDDDDGGAGRERDGTAGGPSR